MDKVDREKSVFEVQKADVQRLLGEALDDPMLPRMPERIMKKITDALAVLDNMEEGEAANILEQAEAMGGNLWCFTCENRHKFDAQLFTCRHCDQNPLTQPQVSGYKREEGKLETPAEEIERKLDKETVEMAIAGKLNPGKPPAEEPCYHEYCDEANEGDRCIHCGEKAAAEDAGCPLSDAMGGEDPISPEDLARNKAHAAWEKALQEKCDHEWLDMEDGIHCPRCGLAKYNDEAEEPEVIGIQTVHDEGHAVLTDYVDVTAEEPEKEGE